MRISNEAIGEYIYDVESGIGTYVRLAGIPGCDEVAWNKLSGRIDGGIDLGFWNRGATGLIMACATDCHDAVISGRMTREDAIRKARSTFRSNLINYVIPSVAKALGLRKPSQLESDSKQLISYLSSIYDWLKGSPTYMLDRDRDLSLLVQNINGFLRWAHERKLLKLDGLSLDGVLEKLISERKKNELFPALEPYLYANSRRMIEEHKDEWLRVFAREDSNEIISC